MSSNKVVIDAIFRPHITDEGSHCWCRPRIHEEDEGDVVCHRFLEPWPDTQPRMSCYSEQRPL